MLAETCVGQSLTQGLPGAPSAQSQCHPSPGCSSAHRTHSLSQGTYSDRMELSDRMHGTDKGEARRAEEISVSRGGWRSSPEEDDLRHVENMVLFAEVNNYLICTVSSNASKCSQCASC